MRLAVEAVAEEADHPETRIPGRSAMCREPHAQQGAIRIFTVAVEARARGDTKSPRPLMPRPARYFLTNPSENRSDGTELAVRRPVCNLGLGGPAGAVECANELSATLLVVRVLRDLQPQDALEFDVLAEREARLVEVDLDLVPYALKLAGVTERPRPISELPAERPAPARHGLGEHRPRRDRPGFDKIVSALGQASEAFDIDAQEILDYQPIAIAVGQDHPADAARVAQQSAHSTHGDLHRVTRVDAGHAIPQGLYERAGRDPLTWLEEQATDQHLVLVAERERLGGRRKAHGHRTQN
jgi:hypothetical protein